MRARRDFNRLRINHSQRIDTLQTVVTNELAETRQSINKTGADFVLLSTCRKSDRGKKREERERERGKGEANNEKRTVRNVYDPDIVNYASRVVESFCIA